MGKNFVSSHNITPIGKPRMTRKDQWKPSRAANRYFAYRDRIRLAKIFIPDSGAAIAFMMPMPRSWSEKKKEEMLGMPHQQTPDLDNLIKGLLDAAALSGDDRRVWDIRAAKRWALKGQIIVDITKSMRKEKIV